MERTVESTFLHIARSKLTVHLTDQIRTCLNALDDEQIWWRPNEKANAVGNLVMHCAGSTRYYIGHVVGGEAFIRDRKAEFAERRKIPKVALLAELNNAVKEAEVVLTAFDPKRLLDTTERASEPSTYMHIIELQLVHYAAHTGQIIYATKLIRSDAIDDLWQNTTPRQATKADPYYSGK